MTTANYNIKVAEGLLFLKHKFLHAREYCETYEIVRKAVCAATAKDEEEKGTSIIRDMYNEIVHTEWFFLRTGEIKHLDDDFTYTPVGYITHTPGRSQPENALIEGRNMAILLNTPKKDITKKHMDLAKKLYGGLDLYKIEDGTLFGGKALLMFYKD